MILLADNDILLKLAICDLLDDALAVIGAAHEEVFVLGTARFKLGMAGKPDKTKARIGEAAFERLKSFFDLVQTVGEPDPEDLKLFDDIVGIDAGEAVLFSATARYSEFRVATGDKTSLRTLHATQTCQSVCARLARKVICFEQIVVRSMDRFGFVSILNKIVPARGCDTALRAIFGSGLSISEENARAGLDSYINDLRKDTGALLID